MDAKKPDVPKVQTVKKKQTKEERKKETSKGLSIILQCRRGDGTFLLVQRPNKVYPTFEAYENIKAKFPAALAKFHKDECFHKKRYRSKVQTGNGKQMKKRRIYNKRVHILGKCRAENRDFLLVKWPNRVNPTFAAYENIKRKFPEAVAKFYEDQFLHKCPSDFCGGFRLL